ncbi:NanQ anomerase/TabA/YiaL family protein [Viscerimonas tarda]
MKKTIFIVAVFAVSLFAQRAEAQGKALSESEKKLLEWFDKGEWHKDVKAKPAVSVDKLTFARHYAKYPDRWKAVFDFMKNNDFATLPLGKIELNENVLVNVQEYTTKDFGDQRLEQHHKNIDVQCVVSGSEFMGTVKPSGYEVQIPYNETRDVGFYKTKNITPYYQATNEYFFIFFPDDIHATNFQFGEKAPVRKVVFKVKY